MNKLISVVLGTIFVFGLTAWPGSSRVTAAPSGAAGERDAWRLTLDQVNPEGGVTLETALAAFALAIGPVPGAEATPGPRPTRIPSGTIAVNWVLAHWVELSAVQRQAVLTDLGVAAAPTSPAEVESAADALSSDSLASPSPNIACPAASSSDAGKYTAWIPTVRSEIGGHTGEAARFDTATVYVSVNTTDIDATADAYVIGCHGASPASGAVNNCAIHINPLFDKSQPTVNEIHSLLVHEMTHCFYFVLLGEAAARLPSWFNEGSASWTAFDIEPAGSDARWPSDWVTYLGSPIEPLFERTVDGVGFFAHLAETGTLSKVWDALVPMAKALGGNLSVTGGCSSFAACAAGWNAAGVSTTFLDSWGSSFAEGMYPGAAWTSSGPGLAVQDPAPALDRLVPLADGQAVTLSALPVSANITVFDALAQVVQVTGTGEGRISLGDGRDATLAAALNTAYCTAGNACACPVETPKYRYAFTPMTRGNEYIGFTGGLSATHVTLTGTSLANFCGPPAPCPIGDWTTTSVVGTYPTFSSKGGAGWRLSFTNDHVTIDYTGGALLILGPFPGNVHEYQLWAGQEAYDVTYSGSTTEGTFTPKPLGGDVTVSQSVIPPTTATDPSKYGALADVQSWTCTGTQQMTLRGEGPIGEYVVDLKRDPTSPSESSHARD